MTYHFNNRWHHLVNCQLRAETISSLLKQQWLTKSFKFNCNYGVLIDDLHLWKSGIPEKSGKMASLPLWPPVIGRHVAMGAGKGKISVKLWRQAVFKNKGLWALWIHRIFLTYNISVNYPTMSPYKMYILYPFTFSLSASISICLQATPGVRTPWQLQ